MIFVLFWLAILSLWIAKISKFFTELTIKGDVNLKEALETLLKEEAKLNSRVEKHEKDIVELTELTKCYYQKVGLVKFNPFTDTGGNQSFTLALLDQKNFGIVITGFNGRDYTRIYIKALRHGESDQPLSKEELQAIKTAKSSL